MNRYTILGFISLFTKLVINHECCIVNVDIIYFTPIYSVCRLIIIAIVLVLKIQITTNYR